MNIQEFSYKIHKKTFDELKVQVTDLVNCGDSTVILSANETALSKYVHAIAQQLELSEHKYEIWAKDNHSGTSFHIDCDEEMKKTDKLRYPDLASITYLTEANAPTVITNINDEVLNYKEFDNENLLFVSFPKVGKIITFNPQVYHSAVSTENVSNRLILLINFWRNPPTTCKDYIPTGLVSEGNIEINAIDTDIPSKYSDLINFGSLRTLLDNKVPLDLCQRLMDCSTDIYLTGNEKTKWKEQHLDRADSLNQKLLHDFNSINKKHIDISNRFLQRSVTEGFFSHDVCDIIVNHANKIGQDNGWTTKRHDNFPTTDLPMHMFSETVKAIILCRVSEILDKAKVLYCFPKAYNMNVKDIFIVKYSPSQQSILGMHCDGHILTFQITLSSLKDYEGGGTEYCDGCILKPNKGALTIQSGFVKHAGVPITKGLRYVLVGFVEVLII
uniref:Fe2OG dioxygenase domain-containing protein n=1 Tax=viral metagenome TaxID=1070528 RepID=A0A6C0LLB4_9ZZZZ